MALPALVLSDSILKHCYTPRHADIYASSGAKVATLARRVHRNLINWHQYGLVIIAVGTNNVDNGDTPDEVITDMLELFDNIFQCKPTIDILVLGIIPRPKDFPNTNPIIRDINKKLQRFCHRRPAFHFHQTYKTFMTRGLPDLGGNYWADDGLHLKDRGIRRMSLILKNQVTSWRLGQLSFH